MIRRLDLRKIAAFVVIVLLVLFVYEEVVVLLEEQAKPPPVKETQTEVKAQHQEKRDKLVDFDNEEELLKFYDQDGLIAALGRDTLDLGNNFPVRNWPDWHDSVHVGQTVMREGQTFLFPVATSFYCGANNCTWHLYSYSIGDPKPRVIFKGIFGNVMEILFSPDESKIAILSSVHGGHCNSGEYLYLLNRSDGETVKINTLNLEEYRVTNVDSLNWVSNFTLGSTVVNLNCDPQDRTRYERVKRRVVCTYTNVNRVECRTEEESKPETFALPPV